MAKGFIRPLALSLLLFFSAADVGITFRVFGATFRYSQVAFLVGLVVVLLNSSLRRKVIRACGQLPWKWVCGSLAAFFLTFSVSSVLSDHPLHSLVKLGWTMFNVGSVVVFLQLFDQREDWLRALGWGSLAIAGVVIVDWILHYGFGIPWSLGFLEQSYMFQGAHMYRPRAFFYEPSYAATFLAFASTLALAFRALPVWGVAAMWVACVLVGSRAGIVMLALASGLWLLAAFHQKARRNLEWRSGLLALAGAGAVVFILSGLPGAPRFFSFWTGPMSPVGIEQRLKTSEVRNEKFENPSSEGRRLEGLRRAMVQASEAPFFGHGVFLNEKGKIDPSSLSMWLEVLIEGGILGVLAFGALLLSGVFLVLRKWGVAAGALVVPFVAHLAVNLNLNQSYPRLDYWLLTFVGLKLLWETKLQTRS